MLRLDQPPSSPKLDQQLIPRQLLLAQFLQALTFRRRPAIANAPRPH